MSTGTPLLLFGESLKLCVRLGKSCHYPAGRKPYGSSLSSASDVATLSVTSVASSSAHGPIPPQIPEAFFLDTDFFRQISHSSLAYAHPVPGHILLLFQGPDDVNVICERYFNSIDTWFSFISRKLLRQSIEAKLPTEALEVSLLLLCMKLATSGSSEPNSPAANSALYKAVRDYLHTAEEASIISLRVLQSLVLVALYEIGHGIFPAAYLTIGRAARLGLLRGVHDRKSATQLFQGVPTWSYWEEERRTWWAVSILERYINLGPTGLPLATPEPAKADQLPCPDAEWRLGAISTTQALYTNNFSPNLEFGPFARACQASHILGKVLRHRNTHREDTETSRDAILDEALQLTTVLKALDKHLAQSLDEHDAVFSQAGVENRDETLLRKISIIDVALCTSARLALYHLYGCNQPDVHSERLAKESTIQTACIEGIQQIVTTRAASLARCVLKRALDESSPLVLHCLYNAATECQWLVREGSVVFGNNVVDAHEAGDTLRLLEEALGMMAGRWAVAEKYLDLLRRAEE